VDSWVANFRVADAASVQAKTPPQFILESRILGFPVKMRLIVGHWLLATGDLEMTKGAPSV
jgi:hypothetical protein